MHKFYFKYFYTFLIQYFPLINRQTKNNRLDYQQVTNNIQSFIKIFCSFELLFYICSVNKKQNKNN